MKSEIVAKYFWAWAKVIIPSTKTHSRKFAYIDLFAGPGRYDDGTSSTPLLILERAIKEEDFRSMLVTIFNDVDKNSTHDLEKAIRALPGIESLKYPPQVHDEEVGDRIVQMFESMRMIPTLFFVDPWGYKGLSLRLINSVLKNWGCDCIFFFNYNRINMGLRNPVVEEHMNALFGEERADKLRNRLEAMDPQSRELSIIEELVQALRELGGNYVLPFCFKNDRGNRTSHHLIFVSKNVRGYDIMKEIMARESSQADQGVPSFQYNPADKRFPNLFELSRPLDELEASLLERFSGEVKTMNQVFLEHNVGTRYIKKNYKAALLNLEAARKIEADPPAERRRKHLGRPSFGDDVVITFPRT